MIDSGLTCFSPWKEKAPPPRSRGRWVALLAQKFKAQASASNRDQEFLHSFQAFGRGYSIEKDNRAVV